MLSYSRKPVAAHWLASSLSARGTGLLLAALCSGPAAAALSDTLHPFASLVYSHDDNLFRLPDDAFGFSGPRGDDMRQTVAGVAFERPIGRQVFTGALKVSRVKFSHYDQLDYNGKDFSGTWEWHLANHLEGHLGGSYAQTLTAFTDFHSDERNLRVQRHEFADAAWMLHPSWRLRAGVTRDQFEYDLQSQRVNDRTEKLTEAGIDYLASSSSRVGFVLRRVTGSYPNHRSVQGQPIDDGYQQDEAKANIYWTFGGVTQVQVLAGWARRRHNLFVERDSSGLNGRGNIFWRPLNKVKFTFSGWREFAAAESSFVTNSLNRGASVAAAYDIDAKFKFDASYRRDQRAFSKIGNLVLPGDATDHSRNYSAGLTYAPSTVLQLGVSGYHEQRTGLPFGGNAPYRANGMSVSLSAQF